MHKKFDFRCGSAPGPDPAGGGEVYSVPQTPHLYLRGLLLRGGRGEEEGVLRREGRGTGPQIFLA